MTEIFVKILRKCLPPISKSNAEQWRRQRSCGQMFYKAVAARSEFPESAIFFIFSFELEQSAVRILKGVNALSVSHLRLSK